MIYPKYIYNNNTYSVITYNLSSDWVHSVTVLNYPLVYNFLTIPRPPDRRNTLPCHLISFVSHYQKLLKGPKFWQQLTCLGVSGVPPCGAEGLKAQLFCPGHFSPLTPPSEPLRALFLLRTSRSSFSSSPQLGNLGWIWWGLFKILSFW